MGQVARSTGLIAIAVALAAAIGAWILALQLPAYGAGLLLYPRRQWVRDTPPSCENATFDGAGVTLAGWRCAAAAPRRGTIVYLHGVSDTRRAARGIVDRFQPRGFDIIAYDSRAHGDSTGDECTYGFYEKQDLRRVLDVLAPGPIVLMGNSLGAAVALQAASGEPRVAAVVAAETFSDLRTVAVQRAPFFFTASALQDGFRLAEAWGRFSVDAVSPVKAASALTIPVLLIHGEADVATPPAHSRRVLAALGGPKRLILVPGAGHNQSLRRVWSDVEQWLDGLFAAGTPRTSVTDSAVN